MQKHEEIEALKQGVNDGSVHPKQTKEAIAIEIVTRYHGREAALGAQAEF